ncbi:MAG: hypothetical protein FWG37_07390 [Clostridia bacterium]|nr:hypothetical protein [Clostridia bacterium]
MKRTIAILLTVLLLPIALAGAEGALAPPPGVDYPGTWTEVGLGFRLFLPNEWVLFIDEEDFTAGNEQATRYLWVEAHDGGGYSLDDVLLEFSQLYDDAQLQPFDNVSFVTFKAAKPDIFCGVTPAPDGEQLIFIKFTPAKDAAYVALAEQILSTFTVDG